MKIVFFGTPDFACPALESLHESHEVSLVITQPDAPAGRGKKLKQSALGNLAEQLGLPLIKPRSLKEQEILDLLRDQEADLFVVVAYGKILSQEVLDIPKYGCFNIHGSLLPKYRGAAPIERAILDGEEETGISIMKMGPGLDDGPVALTASVEIAEKTSLELREELSHLGAKLILEAVDLIQTNRLDLKDQNDQLATYAHKISKEDGQLNLGRDSVFQMLRKIQGMDGYKGAFFTTKNGNYKVFKAQESSREIQDLLLVDQDLFLKGKDGCIQVEIIQAPGKKKMNAKDYLRGNSISL